jgi:nucleotide-binding universal stress UspA family protein
MHSEAAIRAVCERFSPATARIRLVHVVEWPKGLAAPFSFAEGPSAAECVLAVHDAMRHAGRELLKRGETQLRHAGFEVVSQLDEGDVRQVILDDAAAWPADVIVLGSHGRTGLNRLLLGSVSESVVRHAPCSVQIVREPRLPGPVKSAVA